MADTYTQVKDINVNITTASVAGSVGLGIPLVICGKGTICAYAECDDMNAVYKAGWDTDTEVYKACQKIFGQKNAPKTVAVVGAEEKTAEWITKYKDKNFRQIIPTLENEGDSTIAELISAVNTLDGKMLFLQVGATSELPQTQSERVVCVVYGGASEYVNAAVVGESAGRKAGSFTYKNLVLTDVVPEDLTPSQVKAIHDAGGIAIVKKAGDVVTSEGITTDGEYVDIVDSKDYIVSNIVYKGQKLLNTSPKLSFDNVGISQLENVVTGVLADAFANGIIATNYDGTPAYSTSFANRSETSAGDRASRTYNGGKFSFDLAGAIHNATINGTIEV